MSDQDVKFQQFVLNRYKRMRDKPKEQYKPSPWQAAEDIKGEVVRSNFITVEDSREFMYQQKFKDLDYE